MSFAKAIAFILDHEKGLVDDPRDPGGLTNKGIALKRHPELTADFIRNITDEQATAIYAGPVYWGAVQGDKLPQFLQLIMLDCAVLDGPGAAVRYLQKALGVAVDGVLGQHTLQAAAVANDTETLAVLNAARIFDMSTKSNWSHDGLGWVIRCSEAVMESIL